MVLTKIKAIIVSVAVLISMHAEAKVEQFQESFAGTLYHTEILDPTYFKGQSTFINGDISLTLVHEVVDLSPDFYVAFGTFTRKDSGRIFSGMFDFYVIYPDPFYPPDPLFVSNQITGSIQYDQSIYSPTTGELLVADRGFGEIKGFIGQQDYVSLTIDWTIHTGAVVSSVPEPQTAWMLCFGLVALLYMRGQHFSPIGSLTLKLIKGQRHD